MHMHMRHVVAADTAPDQRKNRKGKPMSIRNLCNWFVWATVLGLLVADGTTAADSPEKIAAKADRLLREEVPFANAAKKAPARIDDERFLRRVSLDIIG